MNSLELYDELNMRGQYVVLWDNTPTLSPNGFQNKARSLRVHGNPWVVFTEEDYGGDFIAYEGDHHSIPSCEKRICSAKMIKNGLHDPQIIIFETSTYSGRSVTLSFALEHFKAYDFGDKEYSAVVLRGAWVVYEGENFSGRGRILVTGDHTPRHDDKRSNGWIRSVRPLQKKDLTNE